MNQNLIQNFLNRACYDEQDQRELEDWCNVEKFAELIVKECAKFTDHAEELYKHFGVE